jgi:p-cymene monooxygenase electron transfer component
VSWLKSLFGSKEPRAVAVQPSGDTFAVQDGETILERALKEGLAYPHDCTVGTCGACRTKLLSGKVDAITPFGYTLSREELDAGYILACQAQPKSDLVLEVDLSASTMERVTTPARLAATTPLTHDILKVEWDAEAPMAFKAGQYLNIRWNGGATHRSYSFATAPEPGGNARLTSFIRHVPGGAFTDALFSGKADGMAFELDGPHGAFWLREGRGPILCIAGGSGLAPLISLLQDAAKRRVRRDAVLLFGGRGERDLYCNDEISAIRSAWTAGFDYWPVLSETPAEGIRAGMVTEHIAAALERLGPDAQAYLCGPPAMIDAAIAELGKQGVPLDAIFYDKFTDASTAQA